MILPISTERAAQKGLTCPRGHTGDRPYPECCNESDQLTAAELIEIFSYVLDPEVER